MGKMKMKKAGKRILGLLMAVLMIFQLPFSVLAEDWQNSSKESVVYSYDEEVSDETGEIEDITDEDTDFIEENPDSDEEILNDEQADILLEETESEDEEQILEEETEEVTEEQNEVQENVALFAEEGTEETQEIHVTVSISKDGKFLDDKDGNPMAGREVTLTGQTTYTMDDALKAAHDFYYPGGSEAGYDYHADESGTFKGLIYKLWGCNRSDTVNIKWSKNHDCADYADALSRTVKDGDEMHFYIQQRKKEDLLAFFTETEKTVVEGEPFSLRLRQVNDLGKVFSDCEGAVIYFDGKKQDSLVTDANGKVTIEGLSARETPYFITAEKIVQASDGEKYTAISAAYANVTVVPKAGESGNYLKNVTLYTETDSKTGKYSLEQLDGNQPFVIPTEMAYWYDGVKTNMYIGAELKEGAPADCKVYAYYEYPKDGTVKRVQISSGTRAYMKDAIAKGNYNTPIKSVRLEVREAGNVVESHEVPIRYKNHLQTLRITDSLGHTLDSGLEDNLEDQNLEIHAAENVEYLKFYIWQSGCLDMRATMTCNEENVLTGNYGYYTFTPDWKTHDSYQLSIVFTQESIYTKPGSVVSDESSSYTLTIHKGDWDYTPNVKITSDRSYTEAVFEKSNQITLTANLDVERLEEGIVSYQWYYVQEPFPKGDYFVEDVKKENYIKVENETQKTCIVDPVKPWNDRHYCCIATFEIDGKQFSATSNFIEIEVLKKDIDIPVISKQPESAIYIEGQPYNVKLSIETEDAPWIRLIKSYQWYKSSDGTIEGGTPVEGATESIYKPDVPSGEKDYYYCAVRYYRIIRDEAGEREEYGEYTYSDVVSITKIKETLPWEGNGSSESPFLIKNIADLEALCDKVNKEGFSFDGAHFQMTADITLPSDWKPIGAIAAGKTDTEKGKYLWAFSGVFDGGGHTLTVATGGKPLLNFVRNAVVEDLKLAGSQINGYGLVNGYTVDYGVDGVYDTGCPNAVTIRNVTLKSGMSTKKAGLIGGTASGENTVIIENCRAESGVVIGYTGQENAIGTFAGSINGIIRNCHSAATVKGRNKVGGLAGNKGQSMGLCIVENSSFTGTVSASGNWVGGILGSGYEADSAPNTPVASVKNCYVAGNVSGASNVGGIFGGEPSCKQCWGNGSGAIANNFFYGTVSGSSNVGAIVGYLRSFDKFQGISNNYFLDTCGASQGIGGIGIILTKENDPEYGIDYEFDQTLYCFPRTADEFRNGTVKNGLNSGNYHNWVQGSDYPVYGQAAYATGLTLTGNYKKEYYIGEELDLSGGTFTVTWSDGTKTYPEAKEITVIGYDPNKRGSQMLSLKYGAVETTITVGVILRSGQIEVSFTLLGDYVHDSDADGNCHTLSSQNLETWIPETKMIVSNNAKVKNVLEQALSANGMTCENPKGNYVSAITRNGVKLAEFTNGKNSGWMYTLNGKHPDLGINEQYLNNGDVIVFHYTDDYVNEEHVHHWAAGWSSNGVVHWHECEWACGQRKDQASHSWSAWKTTKAATYTTAAVQTRYCTVCGREQTQSVGSPLPQPAPKPNPTMQVNASRITLKYGQSTTGLKVTGLQSGDYVQSYKSSNTKIFKVNGNGKITAKKKAGSATLTITLKSGLSRNVTVTVQKGTVKTAKVSGVAKKITLNKGKKYTLKPVITPFTSQEKVTYTSSNKKVAKVTSRGVITAKKSGTAKITVKSGKKKAVLAVTVPKTATKSISVASAVSVKKGKTYTLKAKRTPANSEEKITYRSSNKKVATVTNSGKIKGVKKGTATITVKSGKVTKKVTVTVK